MNFRQSVQTEFVRKRSVFARRKPLNIQNVYELTDGPSKGDLVIELKDGRIFVRQVGADGPHRLRQSGRFPGGGTTDKELYSIEMRLREYLRSQDTSRPAEAQESRSPTAAGTDVVLVAPANTERPFLNESPP